jgi:hypothetical protein
MSRTAIIVERDETAWHNHVSTWPFRTRTNLLYARCLSCRKWTTNGSHCATCTEARAVPLFMQGWHWVRAKVEQIPWTPNCPDCHDLTLCQKHAQVWLRSLAIPIRRTWPFWAGLPIGGDPNETPLDFHYRYENYKGALDRVLEDAREHPHLSSAEPWLEHTSREEWFKLGYGPVQEHAPTGNGTVFSWPSVFREIYAGNVSGKFRVHDIHEKTSDPNVHCPLRYQYRGWMFWTGSVNASTHTRQQLTTERRTFWAQQGGLSNRMMSFADPGYHYDTELSPERSKNFQAVILYRLCESVRRAPAVLRHPYPDGGQVGVPALSTDEHLPNPALEERIEASANVVSQLRSEYTRMADYQTAKTPELYAAWEARLQLEEDELAAVDEHSKGIYRPEGYSDRIGMSLCVYDKRYHDRQVYEPWDVHRSEAWSELASRQSDDEQQDSEEDRHLNNGSDYIGHNNQTVKGAEGEWTGTEPTKEAAKLRLIYNGKNLTRESAAGKHLAVEIHFYPKAKQDAQTFAEETNTAYKPEGPMSEAARQQKSRRQRFLDSWVQGKCPTGVCKADRCAAPGLDITEREETHAINELYAAHPDPLPVGTWYTTVWLNDRLRFIQLDIEKFRRSPSDGPRQLAERAFVDAWEKKEKQLIRDRHRDAAQKGEAWNGQPAKIHRMVAEAFEDATIYEVTASTYDPES